jgi:hypothetical protein
MSTAFSGMGGAFVYVKMVKKDRTEKPAIITRIAECLHHGERVPALPGISVISCPLSTGTSVLGSRTWRIVHRSASQCSVGLKLSF